jgi:hypothetical protein
VINFSQDGHSILFIASDEARRSTSSVTTDRKNGKMLMMEKHTYYMEIGISSKADVYDISQ